MTSQAPQPPDHQPARARIVREAKDILLKRLAQSLRGTFLAGLGLDLAPIVEVLPAELPILEVRVQLPDLLFRLADGNILHVEFQSTVSAGDLRRFSRYNYAVGEHYAVSNQEPLLVYTAVLYGQGISQAPVAHTFRYMRSMLSTANTVCSRRIAATVSGTLIIGSWLHGRPLGPPDCLSVL